MTGNEALKIAAAAIRWAMADAQRKEARAQLKKIRKGVEDAYDAGSCTVDYLGYIGQQDAALRRRLGAQVGGDQIGLRNACETVLRAGVELPRIRDTRTIAEGLDEISGELELLIKAAQGIGDA